MLGGGGTSRQQGANKVTKKEQTNIMSTLRERELGKGRKYGGRVMYDATSTSPYLMSSSIEKRINSSFNDVITVVKNLRSAIDKAKWGDIEHAVHLVYHKLTEDTNPDQPYHVKPKSRQEREVFVAVGGMQTILRLFAKPFAEVDARTMPATSFQRYAETWNEMLLILREVSYSIPSLSERVFDQSHVVFLFTMLAHRSVFEHSVSLLEEILAVRIETFSLVLVPDLYTLITKFTPRQLAHFCRVLSLVLFEPEDRQIMEGSQVLRSLDLLQLRRDRMAKACTIVERNQCLMIQMPLFLDRMVCLMKVINYAPRFVYSQRISQSSLSTLPFNTPS